MKHEGAEALGFLRGYFGGSKSTFLIGGAGFDPRAAVVPRELAAVCADRLSALYFREERRSAEPENRAHADENLDILEALPGSSQFVPVNIFSEDGAVIGGRRAVAEITSSDLSSYSDIVVDLSALSKGLAFPIVKLLLEKIDLGYLKANLHLLVIENSQVDGSITATSSDKVEGIHGFGGGRTLSKAVDQVKLWIPQLVSGLQTVADRIFDTLDPDEVCPILPFPGHDPYLPANLLFDYREQVENRWEVAEGGLIHAAESDPLDLYRSILRVDSQRSAIFSGTRGALTIVSPLGSKLLSIGALLAALERDLPIVHVEAVGFDVDWSAPVWKSDGRLVHIWLAGDVYPSPGLGSESEDGA